jgi:arsenate reductase (thioredoxin)
MQMDQSPLMRQRLEATVAKLSDEFRGVFSRETVARYLGESYAQVGDRRTVGPNFLPVVIARFAREQLWAIAQSEGRVEKALPEVLFVCERNAGRSQMAAALADHLSLGWVEVRSAGSHPEEQIDPVVVVTLGCGDACPVYPGRRYQDWPMPDPAGRPLEVVRRIRHELYHRVWKLLESLVPTGDLIALHRPIGGQR